jgi:hypothetical protein
MAIGSNRLRQFEAFGLCLGEAILIETTARAVKPFRIDLSQQPVGSHFRQDIEGMSQRFPCAFESMETHEWPPAHASSRCAGVLAL